MLTLLSENDWKTSPLIVNLNNEITLEEHTASLTQFSKSRPTLPPMVIITPYDTTFSMWTKTKPIAPILHRVAKLAAITKNNLMNKLQNATDIKVNLDFVIKLIIFNLIFAGDLSSSFRNLRRYHLS